MEIINIKTLVFRYDKLREGRYLLTLYEQENPERFIRHPLQFSFIEKITPEKHFKKFSRLENNNYIKDLKVKDELKGGLKE